MSTQRILEWVTIGLLIVVALGVWVLWKRALARLARAENPDPRPGRELRRRMLSLRHGDTVLHDTADTKQLVLQAAMSMLDAPRGLLLGREDRDSDGNLDVICAIGYDGDPEADPFVQRIGSRTLQRDTTVREANAVAMPMYIADEFDGALICARDDGDFADYDDEVLLALGDHAGAALSNSRLREQLRSAYVATVRALADAIEAKDPAVRSHSEDVARYVSSVAARLELDGERREQLLFASLLHDVGKIGVSERILLKPERLTSEEFSVIKLHPRIGHNLIAAIPALAPLAPAVLHHHERFDGSGYPAGLEGERIPLEARIIGVADSFSAMIADRPYSTGMAVPDACAELERCAGTQFDPEVVRLFVREVREHPPGVTPATDPALTAELEVHRNGSGPLGAPAYALVDNLTLLHSAGYLHQLLTSEARRAGLQPGGFGVVLVEVSELDAVNRRDGAAVGDRLLLEVAAALRRHEALIGGTACRASGRRFGMVVPRDPASAAARVRAELEAVAACRVAAADWQAGDDAESLLARARGALAVP